MYLRVFFGMCYSGKGDSSYMDDKWLYSMADRINRDTETKKLKEEKFVEVQKLRREQTPAMWERLKGWTKEACAGMNKQIGREVAQFSDATGLDFTVRGIGDGMHTTMTARFDPNLLMIKYESQSGDPSAEYELEMDGDGVRFSDKRHGGTAYSIEEIGKTIMEHALKVYHY